MARLRPMPEERPEMTRPRRPALLALAAAALAAACAEPPPPTPPTNVALTVSRAQDMNGGAPAKVQVFYLTSPAKFETQDYFTLADEAQGALGADLVGEEEYLLRPGEEVAATQSFMPGPITPSAIGVIAGFRSVDQPGGKATAPLAANANNAVSVSVGADTVTIESGMESAPE